MGGKAKGEGVKEDNEMREKREGVKVGRSGKGEMVKRGKRRNKGKKEVGGIRESG